LQYARGHKLIDARVAVTQKGLKHILIIAADSRCRARYSGRSARQEKARSFNHGLAISWMADRGEISTVGQLRIAGYVLAVLESGCRNAKALKQLLSLPKIPFEPERARRLRSLAKESAPLT
jgi:hypothetical protein